MDEAMNLDLNLGPNSPDREIGHGLLPPSEPMNLEVDGLENRLNKLRRYYQLRRAARERSRMQQFQNIDSIVAETSIALELMVNAGGDGDGDGGLQPGEGSVVGSEVRNTECENNENNVEDEVLLGEKRDSQRVNGGDEGGFFDCNICFELAKDPVVTCCGHLFCWPCIYQWLHVHSHAKECPICKGEVNIKGLTPIYGRGNNNNPKEDPSPNIPVRPNGSRVESWRQTVPRNALDSPIEEMIRRLAQDSVQEQPQTADNGHTLSSSLFNRILNTRGLRRERNTVAVPPEEMVDLTRQSSRLSSLLLRRSHSHREANIINLTSVLTSAERLVESYFRDHPVETNEEQAPHIDDRDSLSSIAAVILSEGQTVDTAVDIDSTVSVSTASSRRRNDAPRVSDIDSGDSRAPRRRRLN